MDPDWSGLLSHRPALSRHSWDTGAYPSGVVFSPDSTRFASTSELSQFYVFDTKTHAALSTFPMPSWPAGCMDVTDMTRVAFSRGGKFVYAYGGCGLPATSGLLFWAPVP
jgi:hypothetical protein